MVSNFEQALETLAEFPEEKKNIVIELIFKLKESSEMTKLRTEVDLRRKEIKQGKLLSHDDFWADV